MKDFVLCYRQCYYKKYKVCLKFSSSPRTVSSINCSLPLITFHLSFAGISPLKGTSLYELFLVYQQRALNWKRTNLKSTGDILAAMKVSGYKTSVPS